MVINGRTNKVTFGFWGRKYIPNEIVEVKYSIKDRWIRIFYRKKDGTLDSDYFICWGQYNEQLNNLNFKNDLNRLKSFLV